MGEIQTGVAQGSILKNYWTILLRARTFNTFIDVFAEFVSKKMSPTVTSIAIFE